MWTTGEGYLQQQRWAQSNSTIKKFYSTMDHDYVTTEGAPLQLIFQTQYTLSLLETLRSRDYMQFGQNNIKLGEHRKEWLEPHVSLSTLFFYGGVVTGLILRVSGKQLKLFWWIRCQLLCLEDRIWQHSSIFPAWRFLLSVLVSLIHPAYTPTRRGNISY